MTATDICGNGGGNSWRVDWSVEVTPGEESSVWYLALECCGVTDRCGLVGNVVPRCERL